MAVVVADGYPNFSICGIPYLISGEVDHWQSLAHRSEDDLTDTGMTLVLNTRATRIDAAGRILQVVGPDGVTSTLDFDELIVGTGAVRNRPAIAGLEALGAADGVHLVHSMRNTFALLESLERIKTVTM